MNVPCIDPETYGVCSAARGRVLNFNTDYMLDFNRYADPDANPYVVGSQAYNIAHGLPVGPSWIERTSAAADARVAAAAALSNGTVSGALSAENSDALGSVTSLAPLIVIGIVALLIMRR